jgi:transposase
MTLLRRVRALSLPTYPAPTVVGIDDWAWRKGHTYGTLVVDLERHRPIALLPNREADTVAQWLHAHPAIVVVARERAEAYAEAATRGTPAAQQVADRWHVLRNLGDTVAQIFERYVRHLRPHLPASPLPVTHVHHAADGAMVVAPPPQSPHAAARAAQRRTHRLARYEQVRQLHAQGWPCRAIARELGINRATVTKLVQAAEFPERHPASRRRPSVLDPHIPYILDRWNAGCRNGTQIMRELEQRGYCGKRSVALNYITRLRHALGIPAKKRSITTGTVVDPRPRPLTPRAAAWLVLRRTDTLDATDQQHLTALRMAHPDINAVITLAHTFTTIVRTQQVDALDAWVAAAAASPFRAFRAFAASLRKDYKAVRAGIALPWNTEPVEGQINRVKMIKRQMFGRAGLDLLAIRVLYAP